MVGLGMSGIQTIYYIFGINVVYVQSNDGHSTQCISNVIRSVLCIIIFEMNDAFDHSQLSR